MGGHEIRWTARSIFNRGAASKGHDGTIYFGGTQGLVQFNPQEIKQSDSAPPVVLTEFLLANQAQPIKAETVLPARVQSLEKIVLNHTDNIFGIEFSALNYKQPENNRYAYKLEELSDEWIETDGKPARDVHESESGRLRFPRQSCQ